MQEERDAFVLVLEIYTPAHLIEDLKYHENTMHRIPKFHQISYCRNAQLQQFRAIFP